MKQVEETVEDTGNNREFCSIRSFIHYLHTVSPPDTVFTLITAWICKNKNSIQNLTHAHKMPRIQTLLVTRERLKTQ